MLIFTDLKIFSNNFADSATSIDGEIIIFFTIVEYNFFTNVKEFFSVPDTTFGVLKKLKILFPGSSLSGENPKKTFFEKVKS